MTASRDWITPETRREAARTGARALQKRLNRLLFGPPAALAGEALEQAFQTRHTFTEFADVPA